MEETEFSTAYKSMHMLVKAGLQPTGKLMSLQREDWQVTLCVITERKSRGGHCILLVKVVSVGADGCR